MIILASRIKLLCICIVSIGVTLYGLNTILKIYFPVNFIRIEMKDYIIRADRMRYEPKPRAGEFNADGIRSDREYDIPKPENTYRILVIGDSLAYGYHVSLKNTFARSLEDILNTNPPDGKTVEVINLGVIGYDARQIYMRLIEKGMRYEPDMVIYFHWLDDSYVSDHGMSDFSKNPIRRVAQQAYEQGSHSAPGIVNRLIRRLAYTQTFQRVFLLASRVVKPADTSREDMSPRAMQVPDAISTAYSLFQDQYEKGEFTDVRGFEQYYKAYAKKENFMYWNQQLGLIHKVCETAGIPCVFLSTPVLYLEPNGRYPYAALGSLIALVSQQNGFCFLDAKEWLSQYPLDSLRVDTKDPEHPSAVANHLLAKEVAHRLDLSVPACAQKN